MEYDKMTLEECFTIYHVGKVACECNADEKEVKFVEE